MPVKQACKQVTQRAVRDQILTRCALDNFLSVLTFWANSKNMSSRWAAFGWPFVKQAVVEEVFIKHPDSSNAIQKIFI